MPAPALGSAGAPLVARPTLVRYRYVQRRYTTMLARSPLRVLVQTWQTERLELVATAPLWRPNVDVYETTACLAVTIEVAGVEADDLDVALYEDALVVSGERRLPPCDPDGVFHAAEIRRGPFRVEIPLAVPVLAERVEARQEQGLVRVRLPKA
jgi:HSP20 family protein